MFLCEKGSSTLRSCDPILELEAPVEDATSPKRETGKEKKARSLKGMKILHLPVLGVVPSLFTDIRHPVATYQVTRRTSV